MVLKCNEAGSFCPQCYSNRKGRSNYAGHWGYRKGNAMPMPKPQSTPGANRSAAQSRKIVEEDVLPDLAKRWPLVRQYLVEGEWDDGSRRTRATLLLVVDDDGLKGCLNDRDAGRSLWRTGLTLEQVLSSLEESLHAGDTDWRAHRPRV